MGLNESLFKMLAEAHPKAVATLFRQYRMNADIQLIANKTVYKDRLECGSDLVRLARLDLQLEGNFFCAICGDSPDCWLYHCLDPK